MLATLTKLTQNAYDTAELMIESGMEENESVKGEIASYMMKVSKLIGK